MKTLYKSLLAFVAWVMLSVSALAVDVIVVSHGQANDPFWSVAKNGVDKGCADMGISCKFIKLMPVSINISINKKIKKRFFLRSIVFGIYFGLVFFFISRY